LDTLELILHFSTNAMAISADDWQKVFHHKDSNVIMALSRVMKVKNKTFTNLPSADFGGSCVYTDKTLFIAKFIFFCGNNNWLSSQAECPAAKKLGTCRIGQICCYNFVRWHSE
jgi:hypothetical protein